MYKSGVALEIKCLLTKRIFLVGLSRKKALCQQTLEKKRRFVSKRFKMVFAFFPVFADKTPFLWVPAKKRRFVSKRWKKRRFVSKTLKKRRLAKSKMLIYSKINNHFAPRFELKIGLDLNYLLCKNLILAGKPKKGVLSANGSLGLTQA